MVLLLKRPQKKRNMRINEAEVVPVTPSAQSKMYCYCMYAQTEESQQESQQEIED